MLFCLGFKVNPVDLAPQYSSVLTGIVRSGVLGASISTALAGALREKVCDVHWRIQAGRGDATPPLYLKRLGGNVMKQGKNKIKGEGFK